MLQIPHHVLAVLDGFDRFQRLIEERRQIVFLLAGDDRGDDLIEIEVAEECGGPTARPRPRQVVTADERTLRTVPPAWRGASRSWRGLRLRQALSGASPTPIVREFSWGDIRSSFVAIRRLEELSAPRALKGELHRLPVAIKPGRRRFVNVGAIRGVFERLGKSTNCTIVPLGRIASDCPAHRSFQQLELLPSATSGAESGVDCCRKRHVTARHQTRRRPRTSARTRKHRSGERSSPSA